LRYLCFFCLELILGGVAGLELLEEVAGLELLGVVAGLAKKT
jgi:hypothetical protein